MPMYFLPYMLFSTQAPNASTTAAVSSEASGKISSCFFLNLVVAGAAVLGDADHLDAQRLELVVDAGEADRLLGAAGRVVLGVEVDHVGLARELAEEISVPPPSVGRSNAGAGSPSFGLAHGRSPGSAVALPASGGHSSSKIWRTAALAFNEPSLERGEIGRRRLALERHGGRADQRLEQTRRRRPWGRTGRSATGAARPGAPGAARRRAASSCT